MSRAAPREISNLLGGPMRALVPVTTLVGLALVVWANSFSGVFLFDDDNHITTITGVEGFLPVGDGLGSRRLLVRASLALNYALGRLDPTGYHALNLAIHGLAALALFGLVRRTALRTEGGRSAATAIAWTSAAIWLVHPLQTESVTYVIQRSESLMGLCYLVTLYALARLPGSDRRGLWGVLAVLACAAGMASKAVMITAPLTALLYDRTFLSGSFRGALRDRGPLHAGLASTWIVLVFTGVFESVFGGGETPDVVVGFASQAVGPLEYSRTQPAVLLHYLRLAFWPDPLCLDYGWGVASWEEAALPAIVVAALLGVTGFGLASRSVLGFLGAAFFLVLAPTSSLVPLNVLAFEHRMYVPLAAVVVAVVLGVGSLLARASAPRWVAVGLVAIAIVALGVRTHARNRDYESKLRMWSDVVAQRPDHARAIGNLALALNEAGRTEEAITAFREALERDPEHSWARYQLGRLLYQGGRVDEAIEELRESVRANPERAETHSALGVALVTAGRVEEGVLELREALRLDPGDADARVGIGVSLAMAGDLDGAVTEFRRALEARPEHVTARQNLARAYLQAGRREDAIREFRELLRIRPDHAGARRGLEAALESGP